MQCGAGVEPGWRELQPQRMLWGQVGKVGIDHVLDINDKFPERETLCISDRLCRGYIGGCPCS